MRLKDNIKKIKFVRKNITKLAIAREQINNFSLQKQEVKNFIVVCRSRSGSTCLLDLLSSHPQILSDPHNFFDYETLPIDFENIKYVNSQKSVFGFKFKSKLLKNKAKTSENIKLFRTEYNDLVKKGVSIFYLQRSNILERAVSHVVANQKQRKHNYRQGDLVPREQFKLPPEQILETLKIFEEEAKLDAEVMAEIPHVLINYERDLKNQHCHQATLDRCCRALGLETAIARTNFVKIAPGKFEDYIVNWREIRQVIANSPYQVYIPK